MTEFKKFAKEVFNRAVTEKMSFEVRNNYVKIGKNVSLDVYLYIVVHDYIDSASINISSISYDESRLLYEQYLEKLPTVDELLVLMQKYGFYKEERRDKDKDDN